MSENKDELMTIYNCYVSLSVSDVEQHDKDRRRIFDIIYLFN